MSMKYLNFDLEIGRDNGRHRAKVTRSPSGEAETHFELPFSELELENYLLKINRPRGGGYREIASADPSTRETVEMFGGKLYSAVFRDEIHVNLLRSLDEAEDQGCGLRLRLTFTDDTPLVTLPWELLYDQRKNRFLTLSDHTPVVRYLELAERIRPLAVTPPLKLLVMISSPHDYPQLDTGKERSDLQKALADLEARQLVQVDLLERASLAELQQRLRRDGPYHVFHYIGHGGYASEAQTGLLILEDEHARGQSVSSQDLGVLLHDHRSLRLAVLNACEGARTSITNPFSGTAQGLVQQGVPAVVAMQFEISDGAAILFAREFYSALADGYPVDRATAQARKAIYVQPNIVEWATPVLYMRSDDGLIFDVEAQPPKLVPPDPAPPVEPARNLDETIGDLERRLLSAPNDHALLTLKYDVEALLHDYPEHARLKMLLHRIDKALESAPLPSAGDFPRHQSSKPGWFNPVLVVLLVLIMIPIGFFTLRAVWPGVTTSPAQVLPKVYRVSMEDRSGWMHGFLTGDGYIVTTDFLPDYRGRIAVTPRGGDDRSPRSARFVERSSTAPGTVLLQLEGSTRPSDEVRVRLAHSLQVGDTVVRYLSRADRASGLVREVNAERDIYKSADESITLRDALVTSDISGPGDSGAPVLDEDGRVVGMVLGAGQTETISIPIERIKAAYPEAF